MAPSLDHHQDRSITRSDQTDHEASVHSTPIGSTPMTRAGLLRSTNNPEDRSRRQHNRRYGLGPRVGFGKRRHVGGSPAFSAAVSCVWPSTRFCLSSPTCRSVINSTSVPNDYPISAVKIGRRHQQDELLIITLPRSAQSPVWSRPPGLITGRYGLPPPQWYVLLTHSPLVLDHHPAPPCGMVLPNTDGQK